MMREQARVIATQHAYWKRHGYQIRAKNPISFEKWFLFGVRRMEKKGAEFTFLCPGLVRSNGLVSLQSCELWQTLKGNTKTSTFQNSKFLLFRKTFVLRSIYRIVI